MIFKSQGELNFRNKELEEIVLSRSDELEEIIYEENIEKLHRLIKSIEESLNRKITYYFVFQRVDGGDNDVYITIIENGDIIFNRHNLQNFESFEDFCLYNSVVTPDISDIDYYKEQFEYMSRYENFNGNFEDFINKVKENKLKTDQPIENYPYDIVYISYGEL